MEISKRFLCASIFWGMSQSVALHAQETAPQQNTTPTTADDAAKNASPSERTQQAQAKSLQAVSVTGYRQSLEKAMDVKRNADAVVDAISAVDIGKFPDTNAAESLAHLPGITVDRLYGEGEKVSINGTDPALNRILLNGQTVASGDWGGNPSDTSGRTFNYTLLSPEIIGLMEVYKSPEARIDEGSIGGTVIIHTQKPLDLPANTLRGSLGYSYNDRSQEGNPRGSLLWSWKNSDSSFGFLTSVTHDKETLGQAGIEFFGYTTGAGISGNPTVSGSGDYKTARIPVAVDSDFFQQTRERNGIQSALEWRPNDRNEFNFTGMYVKGTYNNYSEARYVCPGCGDMDKITGLTVNNGLITAGTVTAGAGNGNQPYAELDANYRQSNVSTESFNLRHDYNGDSWVFTSQVGYTDATGGKDPEYLMKYLLQSGGYGFGYAGTTNGATSVNYDNGGAANWGLGSGQQAGGLYYAISDDRERYAQFDASRDLDWGPVNQLQMGVKYLNHDNGVDARGNSLFATSDILLSQFNPGVPPSGLYDGMHASGDLTGWPTANLNDVVAYLRSLPQGAYHVDYSSSFAVKEITKDLYAQLNFNAGGWRGNIGVRYVDTKDQSTYWQSLDNGNTYTQVTGDKHYEKPLPSFNLVRDIGEDKVLRFSASKVIARPRYGDMAGQITRDDQQLTASGGNPNLRPYQSTNYDLAGEWYFAPASMLSTELFYRDIGTYIVNVAHDEQLLNPLTGLMSTYSVSSPVNASNAKVRGISLMYQYDLGHGFGIQTNYTYTHASTSPGLNMPYLSKNTSNVIPYYEHGPWSARLNYSWRTQYFTQIGRLNAQQFTGSYTELDFTASYQVNSWLSATASATNLLDKTYYQFSTDESAPLGYYKNGRTYTVGLNFKL